MEVLNASYEGHAAVFLPYAVIQGFQIGPRTESLTQTSYIYVAITFVADDVVVQSMAYSVQTSPIANTDNVEYVLIAIATVSGDAVTNIDNQCMAVTPNPCLLVWS